MSRILTVMIVLVGILFASGTSNAQPDLTDLVYRNQGGSTLHIQLIGNDGSVSGYYINNEEGYQCRGTPYPLNGWYLNYSISFSVRWDNQFANCNSVTAWAGVIKHGGEVIDTDWVLAYIDISHQPQIETGHDTFILISKSEHASLVAPQNEE